MISMYVVNVCFASLRIMFIAEKNCFHEKKKKFNQSFFNISVHIIIIIYDFDLQRAQKCY